MIESTRPKLFLIKKLIHALIRSLIFRKNAFRHEIVQTSFISKELRKIVSAASRVGLQQLAIKIHTN